MTTPRVAEILPANTTHGQKLAPSVLKSQRELVLASLRLCPDPDKGAS